MFRRKKPWVRFVNLVPGVELVHPVAPISEHRPKWIRAAAKHYKEQLETYPDPTQVVNSVSRCPGIMSLYQRGYVVPAPADFTITTWNDPQGRFKWDSSVNYSNLDGHSYIGQLNPEQLTQFLELRKDTLPTIIKVVTRWRVTMSPEIVLLQLPIPYPDHNYFSAVPGILDGEYECVVNVQLEWHRLNDTVLIPAGTPLCHYIPIHKDFAPELKVERLTEDDEYLDQAWQYLNARQFRKNRTTWYSQAAKLIQDRINRL